MRTPAYSGQFKRDVRALQKRGKDMVKLKAAMQLLLESGSLPAVYLDHPLKGQ